VVERDSLELLIEIQTKGHELLAALARSTKQVEDAQKGATAAGKGLEQQTVRTGESMQGAVLRAQLLASSIIAVARAVKEYSVGAALYAARTEQIAAVMDNLARVNGMNVQSVRQVADGIKQLGITTQESRNVINLMISAQLDLSKALDLTRMAQNAAKVEGILSSDALRKMVYAISSAQPEMLRTLGIQVSFENAYIAGAKALGKSTVALTEAEKTHIRLNAVLARSPLIDGSYIMSLTTSLGQMRSLQRYTDDLKNSLGQGLQPALFDIISAMERLTKYAQSNIESFQSMTAGVAALGVAGAVFASTPFLPTPARAGAAAIAGGATYVFLDQDPVQASVDKFQGAMQKLEDQRHVMSQQLVLGLINDKDFATFSGQLPAFRELLRARFIEENAALYKQRWEKFSTMKPPGTGANVAKLLLGDLGVGIGAGYEQAKRDAQIPDSFDLGAGVKVSREDLLAVMGGKAVQFDAAGLRANNPAMATTPSTTGGTGAKAQQVKDHVDRLIARLQAYGLTELQKFEVDINAELARLDHDGATPQQLRRVRNVASGARIDRFLPGTRNPLDMAGLSQVQLAGQLPVQATSVSVNGGAAESGIATFRERSVLALRQSVAHQEQIVRLMAGPGGEVSAINTITALRIDAAKQEYQITRDRAEFEASQHQIQRDRVLQLAQLQHAELERYKQAAGSIYDAMVTKGISGIGDFLKGQIHVVGRTAFVNLAGEALRTGKDALNLGAMVPGQVGKDGKLTGIGRVLAGTPLGVDQTKLAMEQNNAETRLNTQAVRENTASQRGSGGAGGSADLAQTAGDALEAGGAKLAGKLQRVLTSTLAIGAGAYGVASGVQQGGVRGALNGAAGAAGMASGLIGSGLFGASAAAGPYGAIFAGAALGLTMLAGMFKQSKADFDEKQTDTLNRNRYDAPTASNRVTDISGSAVDYDYTGRLRSVNDRPTVVQFHVNAMDAKSFLDRSGDIADALHKELRLGNRVSLDIQQAILGA